MVEVGEVYVLEVLPQKQMVVRVSVINSRKSSEITHIFFDILSIEPSINYKQKQAVLRVNDFILAVVPPTPGQAVLWGAKEPDF